MATQSTANRPLQGGFQDLGILAAIVATFLIGMAFGNAVRPVGISDWFDDGTTTVSTAKPVAAPVPAQAGEGIIQAQQEGVSRRGPAALDDGPIVAHTPEMAGQGILQEQMDGIAAASQDPFGSLRDRQKKLYDLNNQLYPSAPAVRSPYENPEFLDQNLYLPESTTSAPPNPDPFADPSFLEQNLYLPGPATVQDRHGNDQARQKLYEWNEQPYPTAVRGGHGNVQVK